MLLLSINHDTTTGAYQPELGYFLSLLSDLKRDWARTQASQQEALKLRQGQLDDRLNRLTDALLDGLIDRVMFERRQAPLLLERVEVQSALRGAEAGLAPAADRVAKFLELAGTASKLYEMADPSEKRELLQIATSNRSVDGKNVVVELREPFRTVANRPSL